MRIITLPKRNNIQRIRNINNWKRFIGYKISKIGKGTNIQRMKDIISIESYKQKYHRKNYLVYIRNITK